MNIWIVAITDFPEGRGATPRIRNIGTGLVELGHTVHLQIIHAAGYISKNQVMSPKGNYKGILFDYLPESAVRPKSELLLIFFKLLSNIKLAWRFSTGKKPDAIWFYSYSLIDTGLLFFLSKISGTLTVLDVCDERFDIHALGHYRSFFRNINAWQSKISDQVFFKWVDGFAVVSKYLENKILHLNQNQPILSLPLVANIETSDSHINSTQNQNITAAYLGSFTADEGLEFLIDVISKIKNEYPFFTCTLYGAANQIEYEIKLRSLIKDSGLEQTIIMAGMLSYREIIPALRGHSILLLPRLDSIISKAGFPGKLSEYIGSKRPIIATPFGDLKHYFTDKESAFISRSFTKEDYITALTEAMEDQEKSKRIALKAHEIGFRLFHYTSVAKQIEEFLSVLAKKKAD